MAITTLRPSFIPWKETVLNCVIDWMDPESVWLRAGLELGSLPVRGLRQRTTKRGVERRELLPQDIVTSWSESIAQHSPTSVCVESRPFTMKPSVKMAGQTDRPVFVFSRGRGLEATAASIPFQYFSSFTFYFPLFRLSSLLFVIFVPFPSFLLFVFLAVFHLSALFLLLYLFLLSFLVPFFSFLPFPLSALFTLFALIFYKFVSFLSFFLLRI